MDHADAAGLPLIALRLPNSLAEELAASSEQLADQLSDFDAFWTPRRVS
jgi:hypothetical protein